MEADPYSRNKGFGESFPSMPPISSAEHQESRQIRTMNRRDFLKKAGIALGGAAIGASVLGRLESKYSEMRWPPNNPELIAVPGSDNEELGGTDNLVFMGFGQYDGTNAARELFDATGGKRPTFWMRYPSQGFTPQDLAPVVANHILQRRPKNLNLIGVSMGTVVALETMREVVLVDRRKRAQNSGSEAREKNLMPNINYLVAYSSPANMDDAFQGEMAGVVSNLAKKLDYRGDYAGKLVMNVADKMSKGQLSLSQPDRNMGALLNAIRTTNNDSPPGMALSQIMILDDFNIRLRAERYQDVVNPNTNFVFISAASDSIVRDHQAEEGYFEGFGSLGMTNLESLSTEVDHANTAASAETFGAWLSEKEGMLAAATTPGFGNKA